MLCGDWQHFDYTLTCPQEQEVAFRKALLGSRDRKVRKHSCLEILVTLPTLTFDSLLSSGSQREFDS